MFLETLNTPITSAMGRTVYVDAVLCYRTTHNLCTTSWNKVWRANAMTLIIDLPIQGFKQTPLSKVTYNFKCICQKKEKQQYISVGTVRMFIEPSAKY